MELTDELVQFVETLVSHKTGNDLTFVQKVILRESLADTQKTYAQIAQEVRYSETYIKQLVAPKLWQLLSSILAEKVNKTNCRSLLEYKLRSSPDLVPAVPVALESPEGQVPLSSALYIERDSIEQSTYAEILQAGAFIRIKGPRRMGKTSLMVRILDYATQQNYATVRLNLQSGGSPVLSSIDKFLRWFCVFISKKLGISPQLDDYWDEDIGPLVSSTLYFEEYLLNQIDRPLVLALDELNQIFEYPAVAKDFLALLRSWHEETKDVSRWQKLRFVLIHSTDIYIPLETYQSPFNVGLAIELPLLNCSQVEQLAKLQGLDLRKNLLMRLMQVSSGFPYLVRFALYHSLRHQLELSLILDEALEDGGIYKNYLRAQWQKLQREPKLVSSLQDILDHPETKNLDLETSAKLWGLGLVHWKDDRYQFSCGLYQAYFQKIFSRSGVTGGLIS
ncbi:MAG: AAA-like domain-containing protein [Prochlorotrichaceae cyanobacterium]